MPLYHVDPGSEAALIKVNDDVDLTKISVGTMDNNAYLIHPGAGPAILVDAAAEPGRLKALIGDDEVGAVITTHRHQDHTGALADGWRSLDGRGVVEVARWSVGCGGR